LLAGCFRPSLGDQPYSCGTGPDPCPPDYICNAANVCVHMGAADAGHTVDARPPDGPKNPDGFVCIGSTLLRCKDTSTAGVSNIGGNGETEMPCPSGCDASHSLCRQCSAATCSGDNLIGCDSNGQPTAPVGCPIGCDPAAGACFVMQPTNLPPGACD